MSFAWTLLVMGDIDYMKGAFVCAKSLRDQNTIYPIVLMLGEDINLNYLEENGEILSIFDQVIIVPIIEHPILPFVSKRQKDIYGKWMSKSFTKWNCLTLLSYEKVILLDVDMVVVTNCDELFHLSTPSACFSQPWAFPYCHNGAPNPYIKSNKKWLSNKDIPHGATIRHDIIMNALVKKKHIETAITSSSASATATAKSFNYAKPSFSASVKPSFSASAFIVLLQPNMDDYNLLIDMIRSSPIYGKDTIMPSGEPINIYSISGVDETSISLLYANRGINFTHIHQKFASTLWKEKWVANGEERIIHYFGQIKPWDMYVEEYPDLKIWWDIANNLCSGDSLYFEKYKQIFYSEYIPNILDITVAEHNLTKEIQKLIVNKLSEIELYKNKPKSELWSIAIEFTKSLFTDLQDTSYPFDLHRQIQAIEFDRADQKIFSTELKSESKLKIYPRWSSFLATEPPYDHLKLPIAKIFVNRYILEIKKMVSNRLKITPKKIKVEIGETDIICGNIKINKSREIATAIENGENIDKLLSMAIMRQN